MSRGYWLPAVALGLILTAAQAAPVKNAVRPNGNASQAQGQPVSASPPVSLTAIERNTDRVAKALEAQNTRESSAEENKRARENLEAQQKMANAASATVVVASVEATITLVGVLLVGWTLYHTRRAANEAKRAADAANKTVAQSEIFSKQDLRAYLGVEKMRVKSEVGQKIRLRVPIKNWGKTPARRILRFVNFNVIGIPDDETERNDLFKKTISSYVPHKAVGSVDPGSGFNMFVETVVPLSQERRDLLVAGTIGILAWGEVWYQDVFEEWHVTRLCGLCTKDAVETGIFTLILDRNDSV